MINELNEACEISNLNYIKSREINPTFFLNDNNLVNKHLLNVLQDKYGNILFEACGLFDEYRYYYGITKEDGNSNFTDNDNNPTYKVLYTDSYSGIYINKTDYALLDFDTNNGGHYIISFYPSNYTFEIESFGRGGMDLYIIKIKNLKDMFTKTADKKMIRNCTITSKINTFLNYNSDRYSNPYNYYLVSYVGVNYLNEYSLYILIIQIQDIEFTTKNFFFKSIDNVNDYKRTSSCATDSFYIVILYLNINNELKIVTITKNLEMNYRNDIIIDNNINNNHFFSCIYLFEETILFIYFKDRKIILLLKNFSTMDDSYLDYNENIKNMTINNNNQYPISPLYYDNEVIKINSKKVVIISKYENIEKFLIILFELYNNETNNIYNSVNVRYYELSLDPNNIEIASNWKIFTFKGLFGIYFFNNINLFPGFLIFSFTKIKNNINAINIEFNEQNNYTIKINDYIEIDNNILGYESKIKILSLPDSNTSGLFFFDSNNKQIYENDILDIIDSISLSYLNSPINGNYIISFVTISKEPSLFSTYNYYSDEIETFGEQISQENDYLNDMEEIECQKGKFSFQIMEDESQICEPSCKICNINQCFSCLDSSTFPADLKNECYSSSPGDEYYFNNTINKYLLCYINCDGCNGSYDKSTNSHYCINCKNGFIKMEGTNNCYPEEEIPLSYYKSEEGIYKKCDKHCETCSGPPSDEGYFNCTSCDTDDNYFLYNSSNCLNCYINNKILDLEQKKCISKTEIPDGYFLNENKILEKCFENCKTCSNREMFEEINNIQIINMNCDSCDNNNNYFFKELKKNEFTNCYKENDIPKNYYKNYDLEKNETKYYKCHDLCATCSEGGIENNLKCDSCLNSNDYE